MAISAESTLFFKTWLPTIFEIYIEKKLGVPDFISSSCLCRVNAAASARHHFAKKL